MYMVKKNKNLRSRLNDATNLLKQIERETIKSAKHNLTNDWHDNLVEIILTRMELANKHKETYLRINEVLKENPQEASRFAKNMMKTMRNILELAKAPVSPLHIIILSALYTTIIDTFLNDTTDDLTLTMAMIDKRIKQFIKFDEFIN